MIREASSLASAWTISWPADARVCAALLVGLRVIMRSFQPGTVDMMVATLPPWVPVPPRMARVLVILLVWGMGSGVGLCRLDVGVWFLNVRCAEDMIQLTRLK